MSSKNTNSIVNVDTQRIQERLNVIEEVAQVFLQNQYESNTETSVKSRIDDETAKRLHSLFGV